MPSVFISYSHKDELWKDRLAKQLGVLEREGVLDVWDDRRIGAGVEWLKEIEAAIDRASVAVFLVSADFLTSEFILSKEVPRFLEGRAKDKLRVFPVIVRPCMWKKVAWLSRLQARPLDGTPLDSFGEKWEGELVKIAEEIVERDRPGWNAGRITTPEDPDLVHYLERLRAAHRDLPIAGFATRVRLPIRLESVYVPLRARVMHHAMESEHKKGGTLRDPAFAECEDREVPFDAALSLAQEHGLRGAVVLGDPGTGKTTLLKHFVLAGPARLGLPAETVPVLLELRRLADPGTGLLPALTGAIERIAPGLDAAAFAKRLLRRDHLLVLVDGLDEIADAAQRAEVSRWLEEAAVTSLKDSIFVVTSRYAGYKGDARLTGRFLELHVRDLTEAEARRFLQDWYGAVEAQAELGRAPEVAERLATEAADDLALRIFTADDPRTVSLRDLATNPLLLQILCLVHRDRKHLPERRVDLYGDCCAVLLELWRRAKGMPVVLTASQSLKLLQPLAWWLHTQDRKEAGTAEILPLLAAPLRELGRGADDGEALLEAIRDQSGLLVNVGPAYAFLHLSFQEYLSARHVQDQIVRAPELLVDLAGHFGETWWREVILLAVGLDNPSLFEPLLSTLLRQEALQRDVRLADDLLRDASAVTPRPLLAALAGGIASAQERYHALRLLRALPGWDAEPLPDGVVGKALVSRLLTDQDREVAGMAAELLGIERPARHQQARVDQIADDPYVLDFLRISEERRNETDGTVLLYVPGGEYTLGAKDITDNERPVHRVVLSPFWIAKYPVTNEQYGRFLAANPGTPEPAYWADKQFNQPEQPVVGVSWEEAQAYCRWAGLRLPSEAQWEAAARGPDGRRYPWGNDEPTPEHANFGSREGRTTPVGSYPKGAGPFGALDQAGNVWEWCEDVWDAAAYRDRDGQRDPLSTTGDDTAVRCLRGGSWIGGARYLAVAIPQQAQGIAPGQVLWLSLPAAVRSRALILGCMGRVTRPAGRQLRLLVRSGGRRRWPPPSWARKVRCRDPQSGNVEIIEEGWKLR